MNKKEICVVGCGGIGSYLAPTLRDLIDNDQINTNEVSITFVDNKIVEDVSLGYQNFKNYDVSDFKAEVIGLEYNFRYDITRVLTSKYLDKFDVVISAVDNVPFRKLLFKWGKSNKNKNKYWIDLRSEGRNIAYFVKHKSNGYDDMLKTLEGGGDENYSCQLRYELDSNIIQQGNKIIAYIGSQLLLNYLRGEFSLPQFTVRF